MFFPSKPFQPNLIFEGKAGAYTSEGSIIQVLNYRIGY